VRADSGIRQADAVRAAKGLARALRQDPGLGKSAPADLAESLGVSEDLVRQVLHSIQLESKPSRPSAGATLRNGLSRALGFVSDATRRMMVRPLFFVLATTLLAALGVVQLLVNRSPAEGADQFQALHAGIGGLLLTVHAGCYARHGRLRFAVYGGLIVWAALIGVNALQGWLGTGPTTFFSGPMGVMQAMFVSFLIAFQYTVIGAVAAVAGGYFAGLKLERAVETMSRQELLSRLFELQSRLGESGDAEAEERAPASQRYRIVERFRRAWPVYTIVIGLAFGILHVSLFTYVAATSNQVAGPSYLMFVVSIALMALEFALIAFISFFSGGIVKAVGAAWLYQLATFPALLIDLRGRIDGWVFGPTWVQETWFQPDSIRWLMIYTTGIALVAGVGAAVENRAKRQRRLLTNDPAALMAEMVRIEWLLSSRAAEVCVLVVDVARSSHMKSEADPLEAEYCFREYQSFVETVCARYGGSVHSTAGDGAVVAFHESRRAFEAARTLQTEIETFNRTHNRLASPFRLRVGIHVGHVAAELNKVQFTEVIDYAAHAQATAPVGGIAVTGAAAAHLDRGDLLPLRETFGGQPLFIAVQPTVDA